MNIKWMALFYLFFAITACTPLTHTTENNAEPTRSREAFLHQQVELRHGQSYEEWRKGLPAYWH